MHTYNFGVSGRIPHEILPGDVAHSRGDNVDTNFTRGVPYKIWEGKNVQNLARFLTTFDFDSEYLRNGSAYRKSEKYLINYVLSPIG